jgi:hypothetical protein
LKANFQRSAEATSTRAVRATAESGS